MSTLRCLSAGVLAALSLPAIAVAENDDALRAGNGDVVEPRIDVLITFHQAPGEAEAARLAAFHGAQIKYVYHIIPTIAASVPASALDAIAQDASVRFIEEDRKDNFLFDAELDNTWGVKRIGGGFAHNLGYTGAGIKVANIDSGIDTDHPEFAGRYMGGYDFVNNDPLPEDDNGHGTHTMGTVAGADDDAGVVGVAPEALIYVAKAFNAAGSGADSDIIAAVQWTTDNQMQVVNNSWGGYGQPSQAMSLAFQASTDAGVIHVASSGNFFGLLGVAYPAKLPNVIAVGATTKSNSRASFSDNGPELELAAPGVEVPSAYLNGGYRELDGTSMAGPHAAGTVALILEAGISDTNGNGSILDEVRTRLALTAIDLGAPGRDNNFGFGLVNAQAAVREPMTLDVGTLVGGQNNSIDISGATPGETIYVAYSTTGTGPTPVDPLNVLLGIAGPALGGQVTADASGNATFSTFIPGSASGARVYLQAAEAGNTSVVASTVIQ